MAKADAAYKFNDVLPAVRGGLSANGKLYASPFYAESSFLMYRKDVLAKAGVTMPAKPTWDQVAAIARKVNSSSMAGICLRGKPGWGDLGAAFTTVLNTYGGTWWSSTPDGKPAKAQVDQPAFKTALDLLQQARAGRGREGRCQLELQRVPGAVPGRQGRDVVRRDRGGGPARGRRQPGQGQERLRPGAGRQDQGLGLAVELGARDPEELARSRRTPGSTSPGRPARSTSRPPARRPRAAGRRSRRARAPRPTRSRSTRRRRPRSPRRRWPP